MRKITKKVKLLITSDPLSSVCAFSGDPMHVCGGRITWEHVLTYGGKQINEKWAIIQICAKSHAVDGFQDSGAMNKEKNTWVALNRATDLELHLVSKAINYIQLRGRLNKKYGPYVPPKVPKQKEKINY